MMMTDSHPQQQQHQLFMASSQPSAMEMQRLFQNVSPIVLPNFAALYPTPLAPQVLDNGARKRRKGSAEHRPTVQHSQLQLAVDLNQSFATAAAPTGGVSTGLRLAFDDERSSVTSSSTPTTSLRDEISAQLSQQQDELSQLLRTQAEQLRQALEQRVHRHSKTLLSTLDSSLSRRIREKDAELERVSRRNMELEDTVRQVSMESQMWQSKAKNNEAMVAMLRTSLQQAVMAHQHSRDQQHHHQHHNQQLQSNKLIEGCGESEADDAASVFIDENAEAQNARAAAMMKASSQQQQQGLHSHGSFSISCLETVRACRRCRASEASIVLLPCLHLCLCTSCKDLVDRCPICTSLKSTAVEVYLS